jgi:hypothetical protein
MGVWATQKKTWERKKKFVRENLKKEIFHVIFKCVLYYILTAINFIRLFIRASYFIEGEKENLLKYGKTRCLPPSSSRPHHYITFFSSLAVAFALLTQTKWKINLDSQRKEEKKRQKNMSSKTKKKKEKKQNGFDSISTHRNQYFYSRL